MKIFYMGLEAYESRYTHQLTDWNVREFKRLKISHQVVAGLELPSVKGKIVSGSVLDAHGRTYYAMTQMANLVALMKAGKLTCNDVIFFEDMFTPGMESLPYIMQQVSTRYRPRIFVRCLAQTIDPDDFVNREGMFPWMRPYEQMVDNFVDGILVASEEMVANLRIAGFKSDIYVTGLPFGKKEVRERRKPALVPLNMRPKLVSFAARWDEEKQPAFFLKVIDEVHKIDPSIKFQLLTGNKKLKSNAPYLVDAAHAAKKKRKLTIREGLTKDEYYGHLANSRLLFNCALQDWVSNTVSEADTFGCATLFPAYRSFPEVFGNDPNHLYVPWSVSDAATKLVKIVNGEIEQQIGHVSDYQDKSIERTVDVFRGYTYDTGRGGNRYRKYMTEKNLRDEGNLWY